MTTPLREIRAGGVRAVVRDGPEPDAVLCLHGIGNSGRTFAPLLKSPRLAGWTMLVPDLLGHGDSEKSDDLECRLDDQVRACRKLLRQLPHRTVHVIGHSFGGAVGTLLAADPDPFQVRSLWSLEGNLIAEDCGLVSRRTATVSFQKFAADHRSEIAKEIERGGHDACDFLR
ncbi:MAG: alpha/beta hydrolase [Gemmataceae bacterium]|nr:alpha/beta hydrolase [Gemmataceae bacterium]